MSFRPSSSLRDLTFGFIFWPHFSFLKILYTLLFCLIFLKSVILMFFVRHMFLLMRFVWFRDRSNTSNSTQAINLVALILLNHGVKKKIILNSERGEHKDGFWFRCCGKSFALRVPNPCCFQLLQTPETPLSSFSVDIYIFLCSKVGSLGSQISPFFTWN